MNLRPVDRPGADSRPPAAVVVRLVVMALLLLACPSRSATASQARDTLVVRGQPQILHLYGTRGGRPVVVSSGDGGWIHLGPQVAEMLAAQGFFVVGFDVKAYLESFTSGSATLRREDEPADYLAIVEYAARGSTQKPILIGVSEGAGLSVLAGTDPHTRAEIGGIIGLGLPDLNELGWRWRDAIIYVTHGVPREPIFSAESLIARVSPAPLAAIHSTHDEFVPVAEVERVMNAAAQPKRLWIVEASDHRFSDNMAELGRRLREAIDWAAANAPK